MQGYSTKIWDVPLKIVIFHSYVSLPEGIYAGMWISNLSIHGVFFVFLSRIQDGKKKKPENTCDSQTEHVAKQGKRQIMNLQCPVRRTFQQEWPEHKKPHLLWSNLNNTISFDWLYKIGDDLFPTLGLFFGFNCSNGRITHYRYYSITQVYHWEW